MEKSKSTGGKRMRELGFREIAVYLTEEEYAAARNLADGKPISTWAAEKLRKIVKKSLTIPRTEL